ncbi:hypothetical protein FSZ31_10845 [Sphingorhabdus soli]|uniref:Uncharacterized protein n=1 Tax=Flavisphingopyxis soli TaxID=2601267 RepID=A0A5C6U5S1_9SPHN|nr:hypothetical protein [Sphingorhabdus soli]TXC68187.1 hypothetical protein FSZ31_10845 [Sphingorhabdus soli]
MVISPILLMLAAAQAGASVPATRDRFAACLKKELIAGLKEKVEPDAFRTGFGAKCTAEEGNYRTAMVSADLKRGSSKADANEVADDEISYWREKFEDDYQDYFDNKEMPTE